MISEVCGNPCWGDFVILLFNCAGQGTLILGFYSGRIVIRSSNTMDLLLSIDSQMHDNHAVWSISAVGQSCFATAGHSGVLTVWQVLQAL